MHPGFEVVSIGVEVLNVGGCLTTGDFVLDAAVDFLCSECWSRGCEPEGRATCHAYFCHCPCFLWSWQGDSVPITFGVWEVHALGGSCMVTRVLITLLSSLGLLISTLTLP